MLPCVHLYEQLLLLIVSTVVNSERGIRQCFCSNVYIYTFQISFVEEKEVCVVLFSFTDVKAFCYANEKHCILTLSL
jgi:hypothetical protein